MTPRHRTAGLVALPLLAVLTACGGGGGPSPTPSPTAATSAAISASPGPDAFLADVRYAGFGAADTSSPKFLGIGNTACQGLASGVSYGQQVQAFVQADVKPTQHQAEVLVRSAVMNLCPEWKGLLPG